VEIVLAFMAVTTIYVQIDIIGCDILWRIYPAFEYFQWSGNLLLKMLD